MGRNVETNDGPSADARRAEAVGYMNEGYALAQRDCNDHLRSAVAAYSRAVELLYPIADDVANANSLGAALMNRGQLRHRLDPTSEDAIDDFQSAARILAPHTESATHWPRRNLIGTLLNHANLLLDRSRPADARDLALAAIKNADGAPLQEAVDYELAILARRAYCDAIGQLLPNLPADEQDELADAAEQSAATALKLLRSLRPFLPTEPFPEASARLFRFGARLIALRHPQRLAAFLVAHLDGATDPNIATELHRAASESVSTGVDTLARLITDPSIAAEKQDGLSQHATELYELSQRLRPPTAS